MAGMTTQLVQGQFKQGPVLCMDIDGAAAPTGKNTRFYVDEPRPGFVSFMVDDFPLHIHPRLPEAVREHGGRYLLYGSASRGDVHLDNDVDLLTDFPAVGSSLAGPSTLGAEAICDDEGVEIDVLPLVVVKDEFLARGLPDVRVIGPVQEGDK